MRIAYPIFWNAFSSSGVLSKVENQARTWKAFGHEVRVFVVSPPGNGKIVIDESMTTLILPPLYYLRKFKYLKKISSFIAIGSLERELRGFNPDVIYQRHCTWHSGIVGRLPGAVPYIIELNTLIHDELRLLHRGGVLQDINERLLFSGAAGFVAVSDEIARHYSRESTPITVVANGFPTTRFKPRPPPQNQRPQLVFVGSPGMPWHGIDKIVKFAARIPAWDFHLVGPASSDIGADITANVKTYGYLQQSQIACLYQQMDVAIGTVALHRKCMSEASPLKVREYVSYGIPVIGGYHDTDLSDCDFFLNIGNTETNVLAHEDMIRAFIAKWRGRAIDQPKVISLIDSDTKERCRLKFMAEVIE